MAAKRALIVDDSKSARAFLSRILEKYEINVDSAESAEQAIEYLGHHRPDVIFMDHMMPGMDGFQAVQAIKNNPRTAMIPIMMYTSQEGELYLGQARALGAIGVLPKQIKPTDVSKVLYQLHLVPDRRTEDQATFRPVIVGNNGQLNDVEVLNSGPLDAVPPLSPPPPASKPLTDTTLRDLFADLRRALVSSMDSQTERLSADLRMILQDSRAPTPFTPQTSPRAGSRWAWVMAAVAVILAVASVLLWWHEANQRQELAAELTRQSITPSSAAVTADPFAPPSNVAPSNNGSTTRSAFGAQSAAPRNNRAAPELKPVVEPVPYGAEPLSGSRLEVTRQLLSRLTAQGFRGAVNIKVYPGRFCLIGNSMDGFSLPPDETPYTKCDVVGSPTDDSYSPSQRMPIAFANLIGSFRNSSAGAVDVHVSAGDVAQVAVPYPPVTTTLTAGEWNRAGSTNNRIEISLR